MNRFFPVLPAAGLFLFLITGCRTPSVPTGDTIVSVSWVNPSPDTLHHLETSVCGSGRPVYLEKLPAYSEKAVSASLPVHESCRVSTSGMVGGHPVNLPPVYLGRPVRSSPSREYNLRIRFRSDGSAEVLLEPVRLTRERLGTP